MLQKNHIHDEFEVKMDHEHFYIGETSKDFKAEMTYTINQNNEISIIHTGVHESLKGLGIGQKLFAAVAKYAREKKLKVVLVCPYAKKVFTNDEAYQDIIKK